MLSRFFIDRPIFATVLSIVITLVGLIALVYLPVAQYPRITPPGVVVSINYPGANAQVVAETVAAPIEQQVTGVPGMLYMSSQSGNDGSYSLSCTFDVSTNLNAALVMVQNRVTLAMPLLPTPVQRQGITIRKRTPDILQIINLFSPDGRYDDIYLSNFALINIRDELLRVDGVSDVNILGERDYSIRVWLDPQKLASHNMTAADVANAVRAQNIEAAVGEVGQAPIWRSQAFQMPIDTIGRLHEPAQFGDIIVKVRAVRLASRLAAGAGSAGSNGMPGPGVADPLQAAALAEGMTDNGAISSTSLGRGPEPPSAAVVRLRDVARIEMGALNYNQACYFDGRPAVGLAVYQLPGTNALDVADRVRAKITQLSDRFPDGVDYRIGYDTTPFIRESIEEVWRTLVAAVVLVSLVVLLFLQDWRAMILPMIDVPVSLIGTLAVMAVLGYSLNNISLFGLVLAIGIVVDDAIVVLENIERQMAKGLAPREATLQAMQEITGPIIAITLVLSAVFVPCAFISGITGRFFQQFAVTISASTIISALNALTMTPSRALLILKSGGRGEGSAEQRAEIGYDPDARRAGRVSAVGSESYSHSPIHKKEALPWWIFGVLGGVLTAWFGPSILGGWFGRIAPAGLENHAEIGYWLSWTQAIAWFTPGAAIGLVIGWAIIGPINAILAWLFRGFNLLFEGVSSAYGWTIGKLMHLSAVVLAAYALLLAVTYWLFQSAPTGFVPQQDMGRCLGSIQLPDSSSLERTKSAMQQVEKIARETPGVAHTIAICGISFVQQANGPNFGSLFIILDPFAERQRPDRKDEAIMSRLRRRWAREVPDARTAVFGAPPIPGISVAGGFKVIVEDRGGLGVNNLQKQSDRLIARLQESPGLTGVSTQFRSSIPQLYMNINWPKVAALGLSPEDVNQTLEIFLGSSYVNSFNDFGRHWQVTLQADGNFRSHVSDISLLKVRNKSGTMVSLGTVAEVREIAGPIFINRYNLYTAAPITGSLRPGASTGDVIADVDAIANQSLPRSMKTDWTELIFLQILEGNTMPPQVVFSLAVLFVFLALAALYESWTLPLAVILVVPMCVLCSVAGVLYTHTAVNIFVQIGLVVLVGLACKNAILIVEFARDKHLAGTPVLQATQEASRLRLRPILMTSAAFVLGVVPLVFATGAGAEMRRSLGTAVFSGMLGVTLFGVLLTPVFFYVIQGFGETRLFASTTTRWASSCVAGTLLGMLGGYLLARLGIFVLGWSVALGGCAGLAGVLAVLGVHRSLSAAGDNVMRQPADVVGQDSDADRRMSGVES
jgi:multidrug efflux pump